jgi:hypothetical protein
MKSFAAILPLAAACLVASAQQPNTPAPPPSPTQYQPAPQAAQPQPTSSPQAGSLSTVLTESSQPLNPQGSQSSLATVSLEGVSLSGSLSIENGLAFIGNNGAITAGEKTVRVSLTRGGSLNVCASTRIHLSTDNTISGGGLMIALDRGALEGHYLPSQFSDVVLTPDLRILISGPGQADFSLRVNNQGDTCIDNRGDHAPYVLASSLIEGGAYRVQPNQSVLFERGSLDHVVDNEKEPCGCPPPEPIPTPTTIVGVGLPGGTLRSESQPTPPPPTSNATAAQNPFPLAQSEGLNPPPRSTPVVPAGEAHALVTAPLVFNGETSQNAGMPASSLSATTNPPGAPANNGSNAAAPNAACSDPLYPGVVCDSESDAKPATPQTESPPVPATEPITKPKKKSSGFARFLRRIFGGG